MRVPQQSWGLTLLVTRRLNGQPDHTIPELVKYIPQNYLETICTELKESQDTQFNRELMEVIYSHVGDADRLGKGSLQELVAYLTNETEERIKQLTGELTELNAKIVSLEEQTAPEYRSGLQAQLEQRRAELNAHDKAKPVEVLQPEQDPTAQADATAINVCFRQASLTFSRDTQGQRRLRSSLPPSSSAISAAASAG